MNSEFIFCRGFRVDLVIALCYTMCDAVLHRVTYTRCVTHWLLPLIKRGVLFIGFLSVTRDVLLIVLHCLA